MNIGEVTRLQARGGAALSGVTPNTKLPCLLTRIATVRSIQLTYFLEALQRYKGRLTRLRDVG